MIWELIKRNPAWQVMPVVALMVVASVLFAPSRSGGDSFLAIPFILFLGVPGVRQRSTLLQATLPIAGKQLFLSRIASLMACTWLPILAAVTVTVALRSDRTWADHLPLFEAGAMITAVLLLFQCVRVRTIDPPGWLAVVPYVGIVILFPLLLHDKCKGFSGVGCDSHRGAQRMRFRQHGLISQSLDGCPQVFSTRSGRTGLSEIP